MTEESRPGACFDCVGMAFGRLDQDVGFRIRSGASARLP